MSFIHVEPSGAIVAILNKHFRRRLLLRGLRRRGRGTGGERERCGARESAAHENAGARRTVRAVASSVESFENLLGSFDHARSFTARNLVQELGLGNALGGASRTSSERGLITRGVERLHAIRLGFEHLR